MLSDHSLIMYYVSSEEKLKEVFSIIKKSGLPVEWYYEDNVCHFVYFSKGIKKCSAETAHHLAQIISALIALYGPVI